MNIVFLDAYTLNSLNDLDISALQTIGNVQTYDRTPEHLIVERAKNADIILTNKCPLNALAISQLSQLKYIGVVATGYNVVDIEAAKKHGIVVTNVRGYSTPSVAQLVFSFILGFTNRVTDYSENIAETWTQSPDWGFYTHQITDLENKTLGIIGFGDIGKRVAQIGLGFGMKILANRRNMTNDSGMNIEMAEQKEIFKQSDFVTLHCPLTPDNQGFINSNTLSLMKPTAYLINTARGGLINEKELADFLNAGKIAGAGLDVLSTEPPSVDNPLLHAKNCLITPHVAWGSVESRRKLLAEVIENIKAFQAGKPRNMV